MGYEQPPWSQTALPQTNKMAVKYRQAKMRVEFVSGALPAVGLSQHHFSQTNGMLIVRFYSVLLLPCVVNMSIYLFIKPAVKLATEITEHQLPIVNMSYQHAYKCNVWTFDMILTTDHWLDKTNFEYWLCLFHTLITSEKHFLCRTKTD